MQNNSVIRAYDIRGIIGKALFSDDFYHIARRFIEILRTDVFPQKQTLKIAIARDIRYSSDSCHKELVKGLLESGVEVVDIGIAGSPLLYYTVYEYGFDAGIVVTASHNPKDYNGAKFIVKGYNFVTKDIAKIADLLKDSSIKKGSVKTDVEPHNKYISRLASNLSNLSNDVKVVWDCGGGALCQTVKELSAKINGKHFFVSCEFDSNFSDRDLDPSNIKNLSKLLNEMKKQNADIGFAFDGDGDRIGIVSKDGKLLKGEDLTCFLAKVILPQAKSNKVVVDIKCSPLKKKQLESYGADVILSKTGHCLIKEQIKLHGAALAGESSGHIFINHNYYGFDDALYAASIVLKHIADFEDFVSQIKNYSLSKAINITCDEDKKDKVITALKNHFKLKHKNVIEIDGVRVEEGDFWFLIRRSNTEPILNIFVEGIDGVEEIYVEIIDLINKSQANNV